MQQGEHIQLWQAAIRSSAIYFGAGRKPARQVAVKSVTEAVGWGRGVMSVVGEGRRGGRESHSIALSGWLSRRPWPRRRYGEPEKIRLNCCDFWGEQLQNFHSSFSLSIRISEITKFHFQSCEFHHDGIHIPVYSLSLIADRSSHSFNQNGQPCETLNGCSRLLNFSITQGKA